MDTITFTDKAGHNTLTVKREFLEKCPVPTDYDSHELAMQFNVPFYLHNENGPAVVDHYENTKSYWLNGRLVFGSVEGKPYPIEGTKEDYERILYAESFKTDLNQILADKK